MKSSNRTSARMHFWCLIFGFLLILPTVCTAQEKIAFASNRDGNNEIYIMDADGTNQQRLTTNSLDDLSPSISPDGSKIVFESGSGSTSFHIYIMNIDGTGLTPLTNGTGFNLNPSFNPDGSKILFSSTQNLRNQVFVMNADGSNAVALTNLTLQDYSDFPGSFSPDGSKIAFASNRNGTYEIFVMDANGANQTRLTDNNNDANNDANPRYSPDGTKIVYEGSRASANDQIFIMDANGANQTQLTNTLAPNQIPSFSPDGSKIIFHSNRDLDIELYTMNTNGTSQTRLTTSPGFDWYASWGVQANAAPTISATGQSVARDTTGSYSIGSVNDAEDAEDSLTVSVDGGSIATTNGVSISGIGVSSTGALSATIATTCGASNASFTLRVTDSGTRFAEATLNVTVTAEDQDPVLVLPANIVTSLALNSTDTTKVVSFTVSATDNCDASPTVVATPASGYAFAVGTTTVDVTATDASGNSATGSFTVTVLYNFAGFFQPVDNLPTINMATAGQSIPIKFSLSGNKGLNIFAAGFPASQMIPCMGGTSTAPIEETVSAGSSSLTYDPLIDKYQYVWKTQKSWRGTCRQLSVTLIDGSTHVAWFQFR